MTLFNRKLSLDAKRFAEREKDRRALQSYNEKSKLEKKRSFIERNRISPFKPLFQSQPRTIVRAAPSIESASSVEQPELDDASLAGFFVTARSTGGFNTIKPIEWNLLSQKKTKQL
jgi:hypothetical protein